jgi:hypothetical protein
MYDDTCPSHIPSASDHNNISRVKLDKVSDLSTLQIKFDGVVNGNEWVRIPDGSAVVSNNVRNTLGTERNLADFEKFVGSFFGCDAVDGETALDIVKETEVFARFFD